MGHSVVRLRKVKSIMKTQTRLTLASWILPATLLLLPLRAGAQGSLTPLGAPAPMMKTLAQIEPRTAITNSGAVTINVPGSYYLTTNITVSSGNAIMIATNDVTLDLNGFRITSTAASAGGYGILLSGGRTNITISNGHITSGVTNNAGTFNGSGFNSGITYSGAAPHNVRVKDVSVEGVLFYGIYLNTDNSSMVTGCAIDGAGTYGILGDSVTDCAAINCGFAAIDATSAVNCYGSCTAGGSYGVYAVTTQNCYGYCPSGNGVYAASTALNCHGFSINGSYGVFASTAENCYGYNGGGAFGVYATTAQNCYCYNAGGSYGVYASTVENCYGYNSGGGYGVYAIDIAIGCRGFSSTGTGLFAYIANSCRGTTTSGTAQAISFKYNMP
jgi:hypothetical protein